ncbi:MAG: hypothetical protein J5614_08860 [Paludibacteraceae bacterium]|nr:hypothetical protein [Paludibacteraceae bacterium]
MAPGIHAKATATTSIGTGGKQTSIRPTFAYSGIQRPKYLDKLKGIDVNSLLMARNERLIK